MCSIGFAQPFGGLLGVGFTAMGIRELWRHACASWRVIASIVLVFAAAGVAAAFLMPTVYRAEVLLVPEQDEMAALGGLVNQFGGIAQLAGLSVPGESKRAASVATLKSRVLTQTYIEDEKLLPVLFSRDWDTANKRWLSADPRYQPTPWDAYRLFDRKIRVIQDDRRTGLITLAISWRDAAQAAQWANELVARANTKLQAEAIDESQKTINYLQGQLGSNSSIEVRQMMYRLIEVETKKIAIARARDEYAFRVIDPAVAPRKRSSPNRPLIIAAGFFLGLFAAFAAVFARATPQATRRTADGADSERTRQ